MTGDLEGSVKCCGYCDKLVRWTTIDGKSTAVNKDGTHHQCLIDNTAKRRDKPLKHPKPSASEVAEFLAIPAQPIAAPLAQPAKEATPVTTAEVSGKVKEFGQDPSLILAASNKELAESNRQLVNAMLKVAESNNAIAESNKRLADAYARFAAAVSGSSQK